MIFFKKLCFFVHIFFDTNENYFMMNPADTEKKKQLFTFVFCTALVLVLCFELCGCKNKKQNVPEIPEQLEILEDTTIPEPTLKVFDTSTNKIEELPLEKYVLGVVAAEMPNNFPSEALKAQAILARTFALDFVENKKCKFDGADISTDAAEAQAYDPMKINDAIVEAVAETQGMVLSSDGNFVHAWFHSNSGGVTATADETFEVTQDLCTKSVSSPETNENSQNASWEIYLSRSEILNALSKLGKSVSSVSKIEIAEVGQSGRAKTLLFGDDKISATDFRAAVGNNKLKSTFITSITTDKFGTTFEGKGFGHGVGMSQWGAKILAERGETAENILMHYFQNVEISNLY